MNRIRRLHPQEMQKIAEVQRQPQPSGQIDRSDWPGVTVVILSYNRWHLTRRCLDSVYAQTDVPFQVLILENGSQPDTVAHVKNFVAAHKNARARYLDRNMGVAGGRNRAVEVVDTEYTFLLDNDMLCHPGWLRQTLICALNHSAAFVTPTRLNVNGEVWSTGLELIRTQAGTVLELARWFHDLPLAIVQTLLGGRDLPTNFVTGGAALISTVAYRACGGNDESFLIGFEDIDFSLRAGERGYEMWATAQAYLTHDDEWQPQSQADVQYARERYDADRLQRDAARFKERWAVEVLPPKYVTRLQQRLDQKLGGE